MKTGEIEKQNIINQKIEELNSDLSKIKVSSSLEENFKIIEGLFKDDDTMVTRRIINENDSDLQFGIFYCQAVAGPAIINESIIRPLILTEVSLARGEITDLLCQKVLQIGDVTKTDSYKEIVESVSYGDTILFIEGSSQALYMDTKDFSLRQPNEPVSEMVLSGPREGFTEGLMNNVSFIHRRLKTNDLKLKFKKMGTRANTDICVCYLDSLVNKDILEEVYNRLDKIKIDAVLDAHYLEELIQDNQTSPFKRLGTTERPDSVVGKLLEGRIAILVDGSPVAITLPFLFIENFQSPEDYYMNAYYSSFTRLIRILGFFITVLLPAFYVAIVAFHHEMMPTPLLTSITLERRNVPLPAAVEAFIMLIMFEIIRETGIRMPSNIGQALSIVGALVIGQAAVEANLIAAPMIILVAVTAITGLLIPRLNGPAIIVRFSLLLISSMFGLYGFILGVSVLIIHLLKLNSFGVSQMTPLGDFKFQDVKDTFIRAPWQYMNKRTEKIAKNIKRLQLEEESND